MPKRMNDKHRSIFVKFHPEVTEKEVRKKLSSMGVSGSKVSSLINRWVVDVPFWKEDDYQETFKTDDLVETVHENFDRRRRPATEADYEE